MNPEFCNAKSPLNEMEDLLQLVQNITLRKVTSFHRIPANVYEAMFRAILPEKSVTIDSLQDLVPVLQNEMQEFDPPSLFPESSSEPTTTTVDFTFAHHIQLLSWLKDIAAKRHIRFNMIPEEQLLELKFDETENVPPTPDKASLLRPREKSVPEQFLSTIEEEIEVRKKKLAQCDAHIEMVKRIIREESGSKKRLELRKYLKNAR
mmetsp:Transcript_1374/g.2151  ORF Transcript_1374/g.2151 Transcript_1374/m.2151 type:complete len:206 (-) Transcript_1374:19-636(-)